MKEIIFLLFIVVLVVLFMLPARASGRASVHASATNTESMNNIASASTSAFAFAPLATASKRWGKRAQGPRSVSASSREEKLVAAGIRVPALAPLSAANAQQWPPEYNSASVVNPETTILRPPGSPRKRGASGLKFNPIASEVMYDVATGAPIAARAHVITDRAKPSYA